MSNAASWHDDWQKTFQFIYLRLFQTSHTAKAIEMNAWTNGSITFNLSQQMTKTRWVPLNYEIKELDLEKAVHLD